MAALLAFRRDVSFDEEALGGDNELRAKLLQKARYPLRR